MNTTILNRDFQHPSDSWYQIEAKGNHPNRAAGVVQVIDDEAIQTIVNRFNADAQAGQLRHGSEMLIDHEHFADDPQKESRAYGWLQELQNRADGIYGRIRWTTTGKAAVDGGDYRFFSTEYDPKDLKVLNAAADKKPREVRPLRLDGLSLTNMNNNRGQKPITNRDKFPRPGVPAADDPNNERKNMKTVATKLGLSAEASEDTILAEVTKIMNRAETSEKELAPIKNRVTDLETQNKTLLDEQVEAILDAHGIKEDKVRNRLTPILVKMKNREERVATLLDFGFKPVEAGKGASQARVLNRESGKAAAGETEAQDEQALAQKADAEINDYKIKNRCTYDQARNAVRMAKPELFGLKK